MSNHVHLCTVAGEQPLADWVRPVHSPFADWLNRSYDRIGVVFVRGPKAIEIPRERVSSVIAYIHNNPVRAKVVAAAAGSTWTSHRAYIGMEPIPRWLNVREGMALMGVDDPEIFDRWVATAPDEAEIDAVCEDDDSDAREEPVAIVRPDPSAVVSAVAMELGMEVEQICSRRKASEEMRARHVAVYCASVLGLAGARIATALCISQQGASVIHRRDPSPEIVAIGARVLRRLGSVTTSTTSVGHARVRQK